MHGGLQGVKRGCIPGPKGQPPTGPGASSCPRMQPWAGVPWEAGGRGAVSPPHVLGRGKCRLLSGPPPCPTGPCPWLIQGPVRRGPGSPGQDPATVTVPPPLPTRPQGMARAWLPGGTVDEGDFPPVASLWPHLFKASDGICFPNAPSWDGHICTSFLVTPRLSHSRASDPLRAHPCPHVRVLPTSLHLPLCGPC